MSKVTKRNGKRTSRPSKHSKRPQVQAQLPSSPSSPSVSSIMRSIRTGLICASYLDPENAIWCPHWHGVTTDEEQVQYNAALHRAILNWYRKHVLEQFKHPRKLKHVRQPTPSRVSHLKARVLDEIEKNPTTNMIAREHTESSGAQPTHQQLNSDQAHQPTHGHPTT